MSSLNSDLPRVNILGVKISAITMAEAIRCICDWIEQGESNYVCVTPAHGVMECRGDPELRTILNRSGLTTPDGMAIVWLVKLKGYRHVERVYGPDLMEALCARSLEFGWRHFLYGGVPGVAELLSKRLRLKFEGLQIVGTLSPPFRSLTPEEDESIITQINSLKPDIVWVGIGTPKQERWMADHLGRLDAPVMIGVGAAFDFLAGTKVQAPRWLQRSGFEWAFRLFSEPKRLWRRYIQYPLFIWLVVVQMMGLKQYKD